jgi:FkbM family methyltransferase
MLCVEMNPNTFARLEFNIKRNFDCEYKLLNAAVSGEKRTFLLRLGSGSTADSILPKSHEPARDFVENGKKSYHVQGILFDDAFSALFDPKNDFVDLIKIDIEGAEFDIFTNTGHGFIRRCRNLMMEIHSDPKGTQTKELLAILNDLGFDQVISDSANSVYLFRNRDID